MKRMIRLVALVLVAAASLTSLPLSAKPVQFQPLWPPKTCPELCAVILCAYPSTCGPYVDSTGTPRCGCHT